MSIAQRSNKDTTIVIHGSDTDEFDKTLMVSNEVFASSSQWILNLVCSYYVYYKEKLFDSLESSKDTVHLSNGSSHAIKSIWDNHIADT